MDMSFIVDHHVPAGGIIFQDENPVEVEVLYAMPETGLAIESLGGERRDFSVWKPEVYLSGFRLTECQGMGEAFARIMEWEGRYPDTEKTRQFYTERVGGMTISSREFEVEASVWKAEVSGFQGKIVKVRINNNEERIYTA